MTRTFRFLTLLLLTYCLGNSPVWGQMANSPYSRFGIGDLTPAYHTSQLGMGGMGVSWLTQTQINLQNPALLVYNRFTTFDVGIIGEYKSLSDQRIQRTDFAGNLSYIAMSFPIIQGKWTSAIGIQPYSHINYKTTHSVLLPQTPTFVRYTYQGRGGVSQVFWSNGFSPVRNLAIGVQASYHFGATRYERQSVLDDLANLYIVEYLQRHNYSDFNATLGAHYKIPVSKKHKIVVNLGVAYELENQMNAISFEAFQRKVGSNAVVATDTLQDEQRFQIFIPARLRGGFSVQRGVTDAASFSRPVAFTIGADYEVQDWSVLENFGRSTRLCIGGELTPNVRSTSRLLRSTFRAGVGIEQTPYIIRELPVSNNYLTVGLSIPGAKGISTFNLYAMAGERGKGTLIEERYLRFGVGVSIADRWFIRPKLE
jgi:hypothetical protein